MCISWLILNLLIKCFILVNQEKFAEAINILDKALETISLKDINESAVLRLKRALEAQGKTFKYDTSLLKKKVCAFF